MTIYLLQTMFIIGHRGAAGDAPENTMQSMQSAVDADVQMIEFDVRLTSDNVPILMHDFLLWRTHKMPGLVSQVTFKELERRTKRTINPVAPLDHVLNKYHGQVLLNLELKDKGSAKKILPYIQKHIKKDEDWELFLFSSFKFSELRDIRKLAPRAQLAMLHWYAPLRFLVYNRQLNLTAVGFHRLHINTFALAAAKKLGLFTYAYTVNRPEAAHRLIDRGLDGIVTDEPRILRSYALKHKIR